MAGFFSDQDVAALNEAKDDLHEKFSTLKDKLIARTFKSERARAYVFEGLVRRLDTMIRAIDYVFNTLPPEKGGHPRHGRNGSGYDSDSILCHQRTGLS